MGPRTFSIDRYYLDYNIKVLTLLGMWNPYKDTKKNWLYNFYSFMVLLMVLGMRMIGELHKMWMVRDHLVDIIRPLSDCVSFMMMLLKCINLILRQPDVANTMDAFNWERHIQCSRRIAQNRNRVLTSTVKWSETFTNIFVLSAIVYTAILYSTSIDMKNTTIDTLPISATPVRILLKPFNIWTALFIDCATYLVYIGLFFIHDVLFLNLMMNIATQLDILNFRLINCFRMDIVDEPLKLGEHSYELNFEYCEFDENEQYTPNQELIICIQHYSKIYWMVQVLNKVLQPFLLPQLMISLLWLSILGFNLFVATSIENEGDIGETIYNSIDMVVIVVQILIFCWTGQNIIECSDRVCTAIYEAHWYHGDKTFQMNSMILRSLVMNPIIIRAVGVFDLSALTFKDILMKSYSAIALLRQMYE